jgi:hypothetical protein
MAIDFKHPQWVELSPIWKKIDDCTRIRNLDDYIPTLNPGDLSVDNGDRNISYKERAVFYPVTSQTMNGMNGLMFSKKPKIELPAQLEYMLTNIDGGGISLYQQMKAAADDVNRFGRVGLYTSYPKREGPASRADILAGQAVATISRIEPQYIINWRTRQRGSQVIMELIVIMESVNVVDDDGYMIKPTEQIRELFISDLNVYTEQLWRKERTGEKKWNKFEAEYTPKDSAGNTFDTIQFQFCGSENNDYNVDLPPAQGLTDINISHYINSADWEDSLHWAGQSQPFLTGVNQANLDSMKAEGVYVGGRNVIVIDDPTGKFGFATPSANPAIRQAMIDKIEMMVALGALMLQPTGPAKTATQSAGEQEARHSQLSMIAMNVSEAYTAALESASKFMGASDTVLVELSTDFIAPEVSPQELQAIMMGFISGSMPIGEYVTYMQKRGFFDNEKDLETLSDEINI